MEGSFTLEVDSSFERLLKSVQDLTRACSQIRAYIFSATDPLWEKFWPPWWLLYSRGGLGQSLNKTASPAASKACAGTPRAWSAQMSTSAKSTCLRWLPWKGQPHQASLAYQTFGSFLYYCHKELVGVEKILPAFSVLETALGHCLGYQIWPIVHPLSIWS